MTTDEQIIQKLKDYGHLERPFGLFADYVNDLSGLTLGSSIVKDAIRSWQDFMSLSAEPLIAKHHPQRNSTAIIPDGDIGPATRDLLEMPRCGMADYDGDPQPLIGQGNWAKCRGAENHHKAVIAFRNQPPSWLNSYWNEIWKTFLRMYAEIGVEFVRDDNESRPELTFEFVNDSNGWIGLAQVINGAGCGGRNWAKFLGGYKPRNPLNEWPNLLAHEAGHLSGLGHSRGGIMNPGILNGTPNSWVNDVSYQLMKARFGGEPIPGDDPGKRTMVIGYVYEDGRFEKLYDLDMNEDYRP